MQVPRFTYLEGILRTHSFALSFDTHILLPVWELSVIEWRPYKVVALVLHHGINPQSGHYTALLADTRTWILKDDSTVIQLHSLTAEHRSRIYLVFLVPHTSLMGAPSASSTT